MLNLERSERIAAALLILALTIGVGTLAYDRARHGPIRITRPDAEGRDPDYLYKSARARKERIDINEASAADLARLKGIGKNIAERIVSYRSEHGRFTYIEDLMSVKGVGKAMFAKIKDDITV